MNLLFTYFIPAVTFLIIVAAIYFIIRAPELKLSRGSKAYFRSVKISRWLFFIGLVLLAIQLFYALIYNQWH